MNLKEAVETGKRYRREAWDRTKNFAYYQFGKELTEADNEAEDYETESYGFNLLTEDERNRFLSGTKHRAYFADVMADLARTQVERHYPALVAQSPPPNQAAAREVDLSLLSQQTLPVVLDAVTKACGFGYFSRDGKLYVVPANDVPNEIDFEYVDTEYVSDEKLIVKFLDEKYKGYDWRSGISFNKSELPEFLIQFHDWMIGNQ